jgi:hypothetical protein
MSAKSSTERAHQQAASVLRKSGQSAAVEIARNLHNRPLHEACCLAWLAEQRSSLSTGVVPDFTRSRAHIQANGLTRGIQFLVPPGGIFTRKSSHRDTSGTSQQVRIPKSKHWWCENVLVGYVTIDQALSNSKREQTAGGGQQKCSTYIL